MSIEPESNNYREHKVYDGESPFFNNNNFEEEKLFQMNIVSIGNKSPKSMVNTQRSKIKPVLCKLISDKMNSNNFQEELFDDSQSRSIIQNQVI